MSDAAATGAMRIVIAGGGVAGLEGALALRELAGTRVDLELVAPQPEFVHRPLTVLEPFDSAVAERFPLADILGGSGIRHRLDGVAWVDRGRRQVHTVGGVSLGYDALLLCPGARAVPAYPNAITISGASRDETLAALLTDLDAGAVRRMALVVPGPRSWQLLLYELALLMAARARERELNLALSIFTPERSPLEAFGKKAGAAGLALLVEAGVEVVTKAICRVPDPSSLIVDSADRNGWPPSRPMRARPARRFDRIVALPRLHGPRLRGVPGVSDGFIPVDVHGRILGAQLAFAAGDATNGPVKHGRVAAQQADAAAAALAGLAGAEVPSATDKRDAHHLAPVLDRLRGMRNNAASANFG